MERYSMDIQELLVQIDNFFAAIEPLLGRHGYKKECREIERLRTQIKLWQKYETEHNNRKKQIEWGLQIIKWAAYLYNVIRPFIEHQ